MLLPSHEIHLLSMGPCADLIRPFIVKNLRPSSYDLTIGDEYYIGDGANATKLNTEKLDPEQAFWIPPHAVCFIISAEKLNIPRDISAKVSLRMSYIYAGLVLGAQPPFDPGYKGRAIVMLHNLSSQPVSMRRGQRLATIEFLKLESPTTAQIDSQNQVKTIAGLLERPLTSSLSEIAKQSSEAKSQVQSLIAQMLVFAALVVAILAIPGFLSTSDMRGNIADQDAKLKKYEETLRALEKRVDDLSDQSNGTKAAKPEAEVPKGPK